jgi:hypothetical protein
MTRFFFHVHDFGGDISRDTEGQELSSLEAARLEAVNTNRELLGEQLLHGGSILPCRIEIADDRGAVLAVVDMRETLFQKDQLRSFGDDVTQSAPKSRPVKPDAP